MPPFTKGVPGGGAKHLHSLGSGGFRNPLSSSVSNDFIALIPLMLPLFFSKPYLSRPSLHLVLMITPDIPQHLLQVLPLLFLRC